MTSPTVAVVMCTYNGEKYLRQQLDSILAQTYPIQELIVQDDCSTDATLAILQEYEAKVPFMKSLRIHIIWDSILTSRTPACGPLLT